MASLSPDQLANWLSLYAATGLCAVLATFGAALSVGVEVVCERQWSEVRTLRSAMLFVPKLWLRWQLRYLTATPIILAIVIYYAASLRWVPS
jgi:hypothetical protein